jgi:glyceraldehyde 3-phosphate dehydrogenase
MRVPTDVVGVIDVTMFLRQKTTKEALVALFQTFEQKQKYPIITNNFAPLVSSDFKALPYSTIIDHRFSDVKCGKMVKLAIWYDNEWGYASKVVAIAQLLCE